MENSRPSRIERQKTPFTEGINKLISLYYDNKLTQQCVHAWLETVPEDKKSEARRQLEIGLSETIESLPLE